MTALAVVAVLLGLKLLPEFPRAIPFEIRRWLIHPLAYMVIAGAALLVPPLWPTSRMVRWGYERLARLTERFPSLWLGLRSVSALIRRVGPWNERLNKATDGLLGRPLTVLADPVCLVMLATWTSSRPRRWPGRRGLFPIETWKTLTFQARFSCSGPWASSSDGDRPSRSTRSTPRSWCCWPVL